MNSKIEDQINVLAASGIHTADIAIPLKKEPAGWRVVKASVRKRAT